MTDPGGSTALAARIDAYCACWQVMEGAARRAELARHLDPAVRYTDPMADLEGIDALSAHISRVTEARPDAVILRTTAVDSHNNLARFGWEMRDGGETFLAGSIDVIELAPGGLIARITGFFGTLPPR